MIAEETQNYVAIKSDMGEHVRSLKDVLNSLEDARAEAIKLGFKPLHFESLNRVWICEKVEGWKDASAA